MHRRMFPIMILIAVLTSCEETGSDTRKQGFQATPPQQAEGTRSRKNNVYPFGRIIIDNQERQVDAIVVGRTRDAVIFQDKNSDTPLKRHHYPLSKLSPADQKFFNSLPQHEWEGGGGAIVNSLLDERRRIIERITDVRAEQTRTPEATTRIRALDRELSKLQKTLIETDKSIHIQREKDKQGI